MPADSQIADQVLRHFSFLFNDYDYKIVDKDISSETSKDIGVTLHSGDVYVDIFRDWRDDFVCILFRYKNDRTKHIDLAEIFKFLTNDMELSYQRSPYYLPRPFVSDEENVVGWQIKRLAALTEVMWSHFEEVVIPKSQLNREFIKFKAKRKEILEKNSDEFFDTYKLLSKFVSIERGDLKFSVAVKKSFGFLIDEFEFELSQPSDLFSRFESKSSPIIYVNVFHMRNKFRIGIHTGIKNDRERYEKDYSLDEFSKLSGKPLDPWPLFSNDQLSVSRNVEILAKHFKNHCESVINHEISVYDRLEEQRINFAFDVVNKWVEQEKHNPRST